MPAPFISPLPDPPDRTSPGTTFASKAAAFLLAIVEFRENINAFGAWLNSNVMIAYAFGAGTEDRPSIHRDGDLNTGWWFPEEDRMAASTNGVTRLYLANTGQMGLGTGLEDPLARLHLRDHTGDILRVGCKTNAANTEANAVFYHDEDNSQKVAGRLKTLREGSQNAFSMVFATGAGGVLTDWFVLDQNGVFRPASDDAQNIGSASYRIDNIYATNAIIQTSDGTQKTDVASLSDAEKRVALAAKTLLVKYRFQTAVGSKGDAARIHFGVIAQDLAAAFEAEGLDPWAYAMLCKDVWWEVTEAESGKVQTIADEEAASEGAERIERWGVRYEELFAFVLSAI
ncbi:tail fiber domain-containing protein [Shimia sagamensis]|uniref:Chaperone of endosialidase n=1 Tax=Shimia sagamensis TaxID=1566352 RepID=A0ABY1PE63_9RHOB|nr:tail fiber domain-containing protein [Shimia sagamensis]SMP32251.1 Chaperone of endosialidase [Shimia sagamensis]